MLRVARRLGQMLGITVKTTFLAAHALPPEYSGRPDDYIAFVCEELLPTAAAQGLVDAVDAFCERIAFTPEQTARVFETARALGLPVKLHADQLSDSGGGALVARFDGLSADHVEHTSLASVEAMAQRGTVRCFCRVRSCVCAKPDCHRSRPSAASAYRWPSPPTPTPAPHRC